MPPKLTLVPDTDDEPFLPLALTPDILAMLAKLLHGMQYGVVEIHVQAGNFHKFTEVRNHRVPDALRGSQSARRREHRV